MTAIYWPSELPQQMVAEGFSLQHADGRLQTAPDRGPAKIRGATRSATAPISCAIEVTPDQYMRLTRFVDVDTQGGVLRFLIPDQILTGLRITDENGVVLTDESGAHLTIAAWWRVKFKDLPTISQRTTYVYRMGFTLNKVR